MLSNALLLGANNPEDKKAIEVVLARLPETWNRSDMRSYSALFSPDVDFVNIVGMWWKGHAENERQHLALQERFKGTKWTNTETKVRFLKPDVAVAHVLWEMTGYARMSSEKVPLLKGIITAVLTKHGSEWLITAFQNTERVSPPSTK
jgi:uncharacterized protein (TIGR02246 family)